MLADMRRDMTVHIQNKQEHSMLWYPMTPAYDSLDINLPCLFVSVAGIQSHDASAHYMYMYIRLWCQSGIQMWTLIDNHFKYSSVHISCIVCKCSVCYFVASFGSHGKTALWLYGYLQPNIGDLYAANKLRILLSWILKAVVTSYGHERSWS